ncbi:MAG TPA: hypothetical protein PK280_08920 [Planctomycetota bacterium]|nr:hypothetical protein [Planctomycetota bacterium]
MMKIAAILCSGLLAFSALGCKNCGCGGKKCSSHPAACAKCGKTPCACPAAAPAPAPTPAPAPAPVVK